MKLSKDQEEQGSVGFRSIAHLLDLMSIFINDVLHHLLPDVVLKISLQAIRPQQTPPPAPSTARTPSFPESRVPENHPYSNPSMIGQSPFNVGRSDLDPIGTSDLRIPSLYNRPSGGIDPIHSHDGMLVGPNHAIFDPLRSQNSRTGPFGGDGFLPAGGAPAGARFDPTGPGLGFMQPGRGHGPGRGFGMDPMGGLGQGLPMGNPYLPGGNGRSIF